MTKYQHTTVEGQKIFYREAGSKSAPAILLLHGFPTSSHMFRNLIPALAGRYHVVAPVLPGFGFSDAPGRTRFRYTFERLAETIDGFTQTIGLGRYAIYVFDYGAPGADHGHHLAERQRLRGGTQPGLEPDPEILERANSGESPCPASVSYAR